MIIYDEIEKLFNDCPILLDERFVEKRPGIREVACFLDPIARSSYETYGSFQLFNNLLVRNVPEYVGLIYDGNPGAIRSYEKIRDEWSFGY